MVLNYRVIVHLAGYIILIISVSMMPSLLVSFIYHEPEGVHAFFVTIIPMIFLGILLVWASKPKSRKLRVRDGYAIVALCWILASLFGAVPFVVSGYIPHFIDAFFETCSGFSTTGSSILTDVEALPQGLLFWRSFTHWLGGMGILVFAIAFLPTLGISGNKIAKVETTGPTLDKITPKMSDNAKILYLIYFGFTVVQVLLLMLGDMNLFDALVNSFGSVGTGGFSNYSNSIEHYDSAYIDAVITIFMMLAGVNFSLYYYILQGNWKDFIQDTEFKAYLFIFFGVSLVMALNLWYSNLYTGLGESLRYSMFQSASMMTTTGFATADFDLWPTFSKILLFCLMFIGGCSASTAGSVKVIRIVILFKMIKRGVILRLHPRAVVSIKLGKKAIPADTVSAIGGFIFLYIGIFFLGTLLVSLDNFDMITSMSAMASCLGNIGPGFGSVGPTLNFSIFSDFTTGFLALIMLAGRLELFTIILLFSPHFWNPDK
ncbi:MAG: potassium transporter TrkG [Anaerovorax sp.]